MGNPLCRRQQTTFDNPIFEFSQINDDLDKAVDLALGTCRMYNRVSLKFSCDKLPNMDYFSLTDAFLVLFEFDSKNWVEVGRTEIVEDNLNPIFIKAIEVRYFFEQDQKFKIVAFDSDNFENKNLLQKVNIEK